MTDRAHSTITLRYFTNNIGDISSSTWKELVLACKTVNPSLPQREPRQLALFVTSNALEQYAFDLKQKRLATEAEDSKIAEQKTQSEFLSTITDKAILQARVDELDDEERKQYTNPDSLF